MCNHENLELPDGPFWVAKEGEVYRSQHAYYNSKCKTCGVVLRETYSEKMPHYYVGVAKYSEKQGQWILPKGKAGGRDD